MTADASPPGNAGHHSTEAGGDEDDPASDTATQDIHDFFADDETRRQDREELDETSAAVIHSMRRIWEEGGIGLLYTHYSHNVLLHTTGGTTYGREAVIASTQRELGAYPDVRLFGDDVVSTPQGDSYHTSHRAMHVGSNLGWSQYGPPTGKKIKRRVVAQCVVRKNLIIEEWMARDELAVIRGLGLDEFSLAREVGATEAEARGWPMSISTGEVPRVRGQLAPAEIDETSDRVSPAEYVVRSMFQQVWNWRRLDRITAYYSPAVIIKTSTDRTLNGPAALRHLVLEWLAGFSDVAISIEHMMSNDRSGGVVVATRWRIDGTHDGPGRWGDPTGRRITLLGFSHQLVVDAMIVAEWTVFDEFALLKQIHAPDQALHSPFGPDHASRSEREGSDADE